MRIRVLSTLFCLVFSFACTRPTENAKPASNVADEKQQDPLVAPRVRRTVQGFRYRDSEVLVRLSDASAEQRLFARYPLVRRLPAPDHGLLVSVNAGSVVNALAELAADPAVRDVVPNWIGTMAGVPNDPAYSQQFWLDDAANTPNASLQAAAAWDLVSLPFPAAGAPVVVTVDTGISFAHPDLAASRWTNSLEIAGNAVDDDANGYVDDVYGANALQSNGDITDDNGHGTQSAGLMAAMGNNALHGAGVAWGAPLIPCKALGADGTGTSDNIRRCLSYALSLKTRAAQPVDVRIVHLPLSGLGADPAFEDLLLALQREGVLVVTAAGNTAQNLDTTSVYPASYDAPNLLVVGASTRADALATFSSFGRRTVGLLAPGNGLVTTDRDGTVSTIASTSAASSVATGAALLALRQAPSRDWRALRRLLVTSGAPIAAAATNTVGGRRLQLSGTGGVGVLTCQDQVVSTATSAVPQVLAVGTGFEVRVFSARCDAVEPVAALTASDGTTVTLRDDGQSGDEVAGDGQFFGFFAPGAVGPFTLSLGAQQLFSGSAIEAPALSMLPTTYNWRTFTGTNMAFGDDTLGTITSPFPISVGGVPGQSAIRVSMNGGIHVSGSTSLSFTNTSLPTTAAAGIFLAPFWDDLFPGPTAADNVYWAVLGTSPNRELVVEWRNVHHRDLRTAQPANTLNFQVVFSETGTVLFQYRDVLVGNANQDRGASATVGVQLSQSLVFMRSFNTASLSDLQAFVIPSGTAITSTARLSTFEVDGGTVFSEGDVPQVQFTVEDPRWDGGDGAYAVEVDMGWTAGFVADVTNTPAPAPGSGSFALPMLRSDGRQLIVGRVRSGSAVSRPVLTWVDVRDVVPSLSVNPATLAGTEATPVSVPLSLVDPGLDGPWTIEWSSGADGGSGPVSGTLTVADAGLVNLAFTVPDDLSGTLRFRVADRNGVRGAPLQVPFVVSNVPPVLGPLPAPTVITEGTTAALSFTATDVAGSADPLSFRVPNAPAGLSLAQTGQLFWTPSLLQGDVAPGRRWVLTIEAFDDEGGVASGQFVVTVVLRDQDGDGMADTWEQLNGLNPAIDDAETDADGDGRTARDEYRSAFPVPDAPGIAVPTSPVSSAMVTAADPALSFSAPAGDGGTVVEVQLFADAPIPGQVALLSAPSAPGATSVTLDDLTDDTGAATDDPTNPADVELADDSFYRWRARVVDGARSGPWSTPARFQFNPVNDAPTAPTPSSPADGSQVGTTTPTLSAGNATDADSATLSYTFEGRGTADLSGALLFSVTVPQGAAGQTALTLTTPLPENTRVYWRVVAKDPEGASTASPVRSFLVDVLNQPPEVPALITPAQGAVVTQTTPALSIGISRDPENDVVQVEFEVSSSPAFADAQRSGLLAQAQGASTDWTAPALTEDGTFFWRARAGDGRAFSEWTAIRSFVVNAVNGAPPAPRPLSPAAGELIAIAPTLTVLNVRDPEGDAVTYGFELREGSLEGAVVQSAQGVAPGADGVTTFDVTEPLKPGTTYVWRAAATDAAGATSGFGRAGTFSTPSPPSEPPQGCGCMNSGGLLMPLALLGLLSRVGRRRSRSASAR